MKNNFIPLLLLAVVAYGCGSGRMIGTTQVGEKKLFQTSSDEEPQWAKGTRTFWYDKDRQQFFIVGDAPGQPDVVFGSAVAQADAVRNLAQKIQAVVNSRLGTILTNGSSGFKTLGDLLVSMITHNIQLSIAMTERYWIEWQVEDEGRIKYQYDIFTLNSIDKSEMQNAIRMAVEQSKQKVDDPGLRKRLDEFEKESLQGFDNK